MKISNRRCLILNADYSPLTTIDWRRAVVWSIESDNKIQGINIIDFYQNDFIQGTNNRKYPIPAVAITKKYLNISSCTVTFSRKNIFIRDNFTCQYCGDNKAINQLTYDHVIPKSKWNHKLGNTPTNWTNIVTACLNCNRKKSNRTPSEAGMKLLSIPIRPRKNIKYLPIRSYLIRIKENIPDEWLVYLPDSYLES